jgi:hypothetical protein
MARIMKLHRYIDHDWQMTPIDIQVTRSKAKVTVSKTYSHNARLALRKKNLVAKPRGVRGHAPPENVLSKIKTIFV